MRNLIGSICFFSILCLILGIEQFRTSTSIVLLVIFYITALPFIWEGNRRNANNIRNDER